LIWAPSPATLGAARSPPWLAPSTLMTWWQSPDPTMHAETSLLARHPRACRDRARPWGPGRQQPLEYYGLRERYLPEIKFCGRVEHRNSQSGNDATSRNVAVLATKAL
jgi:hypothetical protein